MARPGKKTLRLKYHGRILDHLGIEMYQSPVAAIAELVANAWDADAENLRIILPERLTASAEIVIEDDGTGMSFRECEERYLNVGWCRRGDDPDERSREKKRPILGRKGIGKFAGFGIAKIIRIETISKQTGEKTSFELDVERLRGEKYVEEKSAEITADCLGPDAGRKRTHGTTVRLKSLKLKRRPPAGQFRKSMARRYLLHEQQADFRVFVNGNPLPQSFDLAGIEFVFPRDYTSEEKPSTLEKLDEAGWGIERVERRKIRWRLLFHKDTIDDEELRGIAIFAKGKLAQVPFLFNLTGGLGGQHGVEYLSGQVEADFLDSLAADLIATERQRVNWEHEEARPLVDWGQDRVKELLRIWRDRRGEQRRQQLERKLEGFAARLNALPKHEGATVKKALQKLGGISTLSQRQFEELGGAVLTAWEHGRLRSLIEEISRKEDFTTEEFLELLAEAQVLAALNVAEAVRTKLDAIRGLRKLIEQRDIEKAVRDYIAKDPWLIHPKWETFKVEKSVKWILEQAANEAGLNEESFKGRVDLALRSAEHLLVVEFVRPGKKVDWDHLSRCRRYVLVISSILEAETQLEIRRVTGLLVADELDKASDVKKEIMEMQKTDIHAYSWRSLLGEAEKGWRDFLEILIDRAPEDERLQALKVADD